MKTVSVVIQDDSGKSYPAALFECTCGHNEFFVFQVAGQDHLHYQCVACDTSYCLHGKCGREPADFGAEPHGEAPEVAKRETGRG